MRVVFRCDASLVMGTGHVMRCLTLADELRRRSYECHFLCRQQDGDLLHLIRQQGYPLTVLQGSGETGHISDRIAHAQWLGVSQQQDAAECRILLEQYRPDWLVIDHYALDAEWEAMMTDCARYCLVIDDLADRQHCADVLLDQNAGRSADDYQHCVNASCQLLIGPGFALLRPEFPAWRAASLNYRRIPVLRKILISFGGADKDNFSGRALASLSGLDIADMLDVTLVLGHSSPWRAEAEQAIQDFPGQGRVLAGINNMAEILSASDFVIGACGSSAWERCCLGVPSVVFISADNQKIIARGLHEQGAALTADCRDIDVVLTDILPRLYANPLELLPVIRAAADMCPGQGVYRVADCMESVCCG